jgi:hypothetical protein
VNTRRQFLAHAPLGVLGVLSACDGRSADQTGTPAMAAPAAGAGSTPRPLAIIPSDAPTLNWIPTHDDLVYTFGGAAPKHRIKPGTRIVSWIEDCFDGAVKTAADIPSKVMPPGHDNPQTGPIHIEGAEPGGTIAVHILKLEPARTYGVSSFGPGFGAAWAPTVRRCSGPTSRKRRGVTR